MLGCPNMINLDEIFTVKPGEEKVYKNLIEKLDPTTKEQCWGWLASKNSIDKRPMFWLHGSWNRAARAVMYFKQGFLTPGLHVCHDPIICNNSSCVNPFHLREDTPSANTRDLLITGNHNNKRKTHCPKKHEYSEENIYYYKGKRFCRTCKKEYHLNYKRKKDK
jgi:hypothetical protein